MPRTDPVGPRTHGGGPASHLPFNGVKVFSATRRAERERLSDAVAVWLEGCPQVRITQMVVTHSGDAPFQCTAVTVFYWEPLSAVASS